jgi:ABC-type bacteriocin/lantibiotic exporter with double-glycine peptidase domain
MRSKLIFHRQEKDYSCVPACLKMVLATFGLTFSEVNLREACDCTPFGTEALQAVDAVRRLGFVNTVKGTSSIEELINQLDLGQYPIAFINLLPIDGIKIAHAIVVMDIDSDWIKVCDPLQGDRILPRSTFEVAWRMMRNLVILIQ